MQGFKNKISKKEALTGQEFCRLLEINYDEIIKLRKKHQTENFNYFMRELTKIPSVKQYLKQIPDQ